MSPGAEMRCPLGPLWGLCLTPAVPCVCGNQRGPGTTSPALLLAGWLAARLSWPCSVRHLSEGCLFHQPPGPTQGTLARSPPSQDHTKTLLPTRPGPGCPGLPSVLLCLWLRQWVHPPAPHSCVRETSWDPGGCVSVSSAPPSPPVCQVPSPLPNPTCLGVRTWPFGDSWWICVALPALGQNQLLPCSLGCQGPSQLLPIYRWRSCH